MDKVPVFCNTCEHVDCDREKHPCCVCSVNEKYINHWKCNKAIKSYISLMGGDEDERRAASDN